MATVTIPTQARTVTFSIDTRVMEPSKTCVDLMAQFTITTSNFPWRFTPQFNGDVLDFSLLGGMRGELDNGLSYDFSARTGESEIQYTLFNTINPSLGDSAGTVPTSFRPSDLINSETQFQADFTYEFDAGLAGPALFAFGGSYG